jgi:hypothetical protein
MAEFSSNGKGNLAVTLGAIGTGLSVLNGGLGNLGIGGLFGNNHQCGDGAFVNRFEAAQSARIAELETQVMLRDANTYTMNQLNAFRNYVDGRINHLEGELCDQRTYNATNTAAIGCIQGQIAQLMSLTKLVIPNASICPGWTTTAAGA